MVQQYPPKRTHLGTTVERSLTRTVLLEEAAKNKTDTVKGKNIAWKPAWMLTFAYD